MNDSKLILRRMKKLEEATDYTAEQTELNARALKNIMKILKTQTEILTLKQRIRVEDDPSYIG